MTRTERVTIILLLLFIAVVGSALVFFETVDDIVNDITMEQIQRVTPGMTEAQVEAVLGRPKRIEHRKWIYIRHSFYVGVHFNDAGRVEAVIPNSLLF